MEHTEASAADLPSDADIAALSRALDRPIVLVGLMGVGKSTIGRRLASVLSVPFLDADDEVVEAAQMSIPEIFDHYGEAYFRDGERRVIARLIDETHGGGAVIATGGGAFIESETRALILDKAIAVWLDGDLDTLVERVSRKKTRPLLIGKDPREVLSDLMAVRNPLYAEAHVRVASEAGPQMQAIARILNALQEHLA